MDLRNTAGHNVSPTSKELIALAVDSTGGGVNENGEAVEELANGHRPLEVVTELVHPGVVVELVHLLRVVALLDTQSHVLSGDLAGLHGMVDTLTGQGINVTSSVTNKDEVLIVSNRLATKTKTASTHALDLVLVTKGTGDVGIVLHKILVPVGEIVVGDLGVAGDDVAAVVQLIVGVLEESSVAGKETHVVENDTIGLEVVGAALNEGTGACTVGSSLHEAKLGTETRCSTVSADEHTCAVASAILALDSPQTSGLIEHGILHRLVLLEIDTLLLSTAGNGLVKVQTLDGNSSRDVTKLFVAAADEGDTARADKTTAVCNVGLVLLDQLVVDAHIQKNLDGNFAHGITAVLVTGEGLLLEDQNLVVLVVTLHVETTGGARRASTNDGAVVDIVGKALQIIVDLGDGRGLRRTGANPDVDGGNKSKTNKAKTGMAKGHRPHKGGR
eukprot:Colp12_sorted_trinity150504_noHs@29437